MIVFKMGKITIECEYGSNSRSGGFFHRAKLYINGEYESKAISQYLNRTWERYPFQTVMSKLVDQSKTMTQRAKTLCRKKWGL